MFHNSDNFYNLENPENQTNPYNNFESFDNTEPNKYYTKFNKNIKAIRGSGVVSKRGPPDTNKSYDTIKEVLNDDIQAIPPLYPRTWDNDPQETSGYLNDLDKVDYVPDIDKYYYTAQQMDEVVLDKSIPTKTKVTKKNSNQVIKLPSPLVTTKPDFNPDDSEYDIPSKYKKNSKKISNKIKTDFDNNEFGIGQSDIDRSWYDGRYLYTFNPKSLDTIYPWTNYNLLYPFGGSTDTLKYYTSSNINKITGDPLLRKDNPEDTEYFGNINKKNKKTINCIQDFNILYLSLLCLLLIIYFIKNN